MYSAPHSEFKGLPGGRWRKKNRFLEFCQLVKNCAGVERLLGHQLEPTDCYQEFIDQATKRIGLYQLRMKFSELTVEGKASAAELQDILHK